MRVGLALIGLSSLAWAATGVLTPAFPDSGGTLVGAAAYGDWRTDAPGVRRRLTSADMPVPLASPPAANPRRWSPGRPALRPKFRRVSQWIYSPKV